MCTISIYVQVQITLRYSWVFFGCDEKTTPGWTRQFPPLVKRNERWFVDNFPSISVQVNTATLSVSLHKPCLLPDPHCTCKPLNRDNKESRGLNPKQLPSSALETTTCVSLMSSGCGLMRVTICYF